VSFIGQNYPLGLEKAAVIQKKKKNQEMCDNQLKSAAQAVMQFIL
jgi:hypothetical protein